MEEDELMEVNQQDQTPASPLPAAQSGSKPNSPARKVASSSGASPVALKPASPAKSTEVSKVASAVGVGKASNPSSPAMQNASLANSPQGMQSPKKSPVKPFVKSSSPAAAHSDDDDFFKYLDFSKSRLKEKETVLNQVTTEKQETGQRTVQLDQERQVFANHLLILSLILNLLISDDTLRHLLLLS